MYMHTNTNTNTNAYTYTYTYAYTHTYMHTYMHTCIHACMHACMHAYIHTRNTYMHAYIHTYVHMYTCAPVHTHTHTCTPTRTSYNTVQYNTIQCLPTYILTNFILTYLHASELTYLHTYIHTHMHTHVLVHVNLDAQEKAGFFKRVQTGTFGSVAIYVRVWSCTHQDENKGMIRCSESIVIADEEIRCCQSWKISRILQTFQNPSGWHKACSPCVSAARPWSAVAWLQVEGWF